MNSFVITESFSPPPFCKKEILRYAGCKTEDPQILQLMEECMDEASEKLCYRVCYRKVPVSIHENTVTLGTVSFRSSSLAKNLRNCKEAMIFAATVGVAMDRLIAKYGHLSPSKAVLFQAIGAERIEALCDAFCSEISEKEKTNLVPRFSPGYGDLPLASQKDIFAVLECEKRIGLTLNNSLLMSPSKSVTAVVGLGGDHKKVNKCSTCNLADCIYRGIL